MFAGGFAGRRTGSVSNGDQFGAPLDRLSRDRARIRGGIRIITISKIGMEDQRKIEERKTDRDNKMDGDGMTSTREGSDDEQR